jgi:hypothetical protein
MFLRHKHNWIRQAAVYPEPAHRFTSTRPRNTGTHDPAISSTWSPPYSVTSSPLVISLHRLTTTENSCLDLIPKCLTTVRCCLPQSSTEMRRAVVVIGHSGSGAPPDVSDLSDSGFLMQYSSLTAQKIRLSPAYSHSPHYGLETYQHLDTWLLPRLLPPSINPVAIQAEPLPPPALTPDSAGRPPRHSPQWPPAAQMSPS